MREACEYSFRQNPKYFGAHYIHLWLYAMRNYLYPSNLNSANVKKDPGQDKPVPRPKSEAKLSELAYFAASRGFRTAQIDRLLAKCTQPEPTSTDLPELSCGYVDLPPHVRCSRPWQSSFERDCKHLSLTSMYQLQNNFCRKRPTSFAVARDIVFSFWKKLCAGWN